MEYISKGRVHLWILISSRNAIGISIPEMKITLELKDSPHILQEIIWRCKIQGGGVIINKTEPTEKMCWCCS